MWSAFCPYLLVVLVLAAVLPVAVVAAQAKMKSIQNGHLAHLRVLLYDCLLYVPQENGWLAVQV